jgi:hypothetical protein
MEMSGQLHAPATSPLGKDTPVTIGQEAGYELDGEEKNPCPYWESNTVIQPVA